MGLGTCIALVKPAMESPRFVLSDTTDCKENARKTSSHAAIPIFLDKDSTNDKLLLELMQLYQEYDLLMLEHQLVTDKLLWAGKREKKIQSDLSEFH